MTKETVEYWYGQQEDAKELIPKGNGLLIPEGKSLYACSAFEPLATAAIILLHVMFCWECENPAPKGRRWTFSIPERKLVLSD